MTKISRYVLRSAVAPFFFGVVVVVFLFLMQFLMQHLDKLLGKGLDNIVIIQLIIYNIAWMVVLAVPMGVLFASLVALGNMSASYEVTIIKASGGSLIKMMLPLVIFGALLFGVMFWYNDEVLPETNYRAKTLMYDVQRKKPALAIEAGQFSDDIDGFVVLAKEVDTSTNKLYTVTIYDQRQINLCRTISSESCEIKFSNDFKNLVFDFKNGEVHQSKFGEVNNYRILKFSDYSIVTSSYGFGFEQSETGALSRGDREMRISDMRSIVNESKNQKDKLIQELNLLLKKHIYYLLGGVKNISEKPSVSREHKNNIKNFTQSDNKTIHKATGDNMQAAAEFSYSLQNISSNISYQNERAAEYEVEIYKKYAIPFACFVFVFVGCPLGIITRGGNFGLSAAITLGFYIMYWAFLIGGEKLADRGFASPMLSMWLGNIIIGILGIILTWKINNK